MKPRLRWRLVAAALMAAPGACLGIAEVDQGNAGGQGGLGGSSLDGGGGFPSAGGSGAAGGSDGASGAGGSGGAGALGGADAGTPDATPGGGTGGISGGTKILKPGLALAGDGFLAAPSLCGDQVIDSYSQPSYKAIHVGRDVPCGKVATYRAFLRFDAATLPGPLKKATLKLYYAQKQQPTAGVTLLGITDYPQLTTSAWSQPTAATFGTVITPSSAPGWVAVDVSAHVTSSWSGGGGVAFELRYEAEGQDPGGTSRWYGIVATENGSLGPELVVEY